MDGTAEIAIDYRPIGDLIPYARNARTHAFGGAGRADRWLDPGIRLHVSAAWPPPSGVCPDWLIGA